MRVAMEYCVYKGEKLICIGTMDECVEQTGLKRATLFYYAAPAYKKVVANQKRVNVNYSVDRLEDDEE